MVVEILQSGRYEARKLLTGGWAVLLIREFYHEMVAEDAGRDTWWDPRVCRAFASLEEAAVTHGG